MLTSILIAVTVLVLVAVIVVVLQPSEFRVTRKRTISAPPESVFPHVNDYHNWVAWSPWERFDPTMKRTYEGPSSGTGAVYSWSGNKNVGEGRSTITESRPNQLIRQKLEFLKPFVATNDVEFTFQPQGDQTVVTWSMTGRKNFMFKAMGLFMSMDKMCGDQFSEGLANLASVVEAKPEPIALAPVH